MKGNSRAYVLDSYALLAYLEGEEQKAVVLTLLREARMGTVTLSMCLVNVGEVLYITERERGLVAARRVIAALDQLPVTVVEADRALTFAAAHIKAQYPLSYADAFVVALAQREGASLVTGDPEFRVVEGLVPLTWL